jgi:hypothetical protein
MPLTLPCDGFSASGVAVGTIHKLGFGNGSIVDNGDGTASYRASGALTQSFRVTIADITGFAVRKDGKVFERTFVVLGHGTELASVSVSHGTSEKIEAWFRTHPLFRGNVPQDAPYAARSAGAGATAANIADQLIKLAQLRDAGALSQHEFERAKAKLLD